MSSGPGLSYEDGILRGHAKALEKVKPLLEAATYVSDQAPEVIGGEPYLVSPGGFYRLREAIGIVESEKEKIA